MSGVATLFAERSFQRFFAAQAIIWFGSSATTIALLFGLLDSRYGVAGAGLVLGARAAPSVVFGLVGGVLADRVSRRSVLIGSSVLVGVAQLGLAGVLASGEPMLAVVVAFVLLIGSVQALSASSWYAVLPQLVEDAHLQTAQALLRLVRNTSSIVGPAVGGVVVGLVGPAVLVAIDGASALVSTLLLLGLGIAGPVAARPSMLRDLRTGWSELVSRRWLVLAIPSFAVALLAWAAGFGVLGAVRTLELGGAASTWGLVGSTLAAGYVTGSLVGLRWKPGRPVAASLAAQAVTAVPLLALGLGGPLWIVAATAFAAGLAMDLAGIWWGTAMQRSVPDEVLGRVSSYDYVGSFGLMPLGYVLAPVLLQWAGPGPVLCVFAGLVLVPTVSSALAIGRRHEPTPLRASAEAAVPT